MYPSAEKVSAFTLVNIFTFARERSGGNEVQLLWPTG